MTARQWWKLSYRKLRIARREALKAADDMMLFGTGVVYISQDGFVNHILPQSVIRHG